MQLRTPDSQNCLMYEEIQSQDLRNSSGAFSLTMNDGSGSRTDSTGLTLDRIFANRGIFTLNPSECSSGTGSYGPNPSDGRVLIVLFKDETMTTWEPIPPQKINFVPYSFETKQVAGFGADSLIRVVGAGGDPLTGLAPLSNAQYTELMALVNGTSTAFTKSGQLGGVALPTMSTGEVLGWNGSAWVSQTAVGGANSVTTAMIQANAVDSTKIATGAVGTTQIANNVSINTSGTVGAAITTTRDFKIYAASPSLFNIDMQAPALAASYSLVWPLNDGNAGEVLTTDGSGVMSWAPAAASSQWTTHGANISYDGGGNVGIGTTAPTAKLEVVGGDAAINTLTVGLGGGAVATNSAFGVSSLSANTTGGNNTALGFEALKSNTTNSYLTAVGQGALRSNNGTTTGSVAVGSGALYNNTTGNGNVAVGTFAVITSTTGNQNTGLGHRALQSATTASLNSSVGYQSLQGVTTGDGNTGIGHFAGANITTGANNIILGRVNAPSPTSSNQLNIGNIIFGTGIDGTGSTLSTGNVGIGTTAPSSVFEVQGGTAAANTQGKDITLVAQSSGPTAGHIGGSVVLTTGAGAGGWADGNVEMNLGNGALNLNRHQSVAYTSSDNSSQEPFSIVSRYVNWGNVNGAHALQSFWLTNGNGFLDQKAYFGAVASAGASNYTPSLVWGQQTGANSYSERMRISTTGDVGIGTTSPATKLDVNGVISATGMKINGVDVATSGGAGGGQSSTSGLTFNSNSDNASADGGFNFQSNGANLVTIANNGDTVINSTTASNNAGSGALVVNGGVGVAGNINAGGSISGGGNNSGVYSGTSASSQYPSGGTHLTANNYSSIDTSYSVLKLGAKNALSNQQYGYVLASSTTGAGSYSPALAFGTSSGANAYQERMRIDGSGNIGVGTTAPAVTFDVNGIVRGTQVKVLGGGTLTGINGTDSAYQSNANFFFQNTGGASTFMTVTGAGKVGIGTTAPASALEVIGDVQLQNGNAVLGKTSGGVSSSMIRYETYDEVTVGGGVNNKVNFYTNGTKKLTLAGPGSYFENANVGIGTSAPAAYLHVLGASSTTPFIKLDTPTSVPTDSVYVSFNANRGSIGYDGTRQAMVVSGTAGKSLALDANGSERLRIDSGGNIGIGTITPANTLDVNGTINAASGYLFGGANMISGNSTVLQFNNTSQARSLHVYAGGSASAPALAVQTATSNVGIGTTAPSVKLDVAGSTVIRGPTVGGIDGELYYDTATHTYRYYDANAASWVPMGTGTITYTGTLWSQSGANLYYNTGSVGLGTSTPGSMLSMTGGASFGTYSGSAAPVGGLIMSGNVGIGTATPGQKLDVKGTIRLSGSTSGNVNLQAPSTGGSGVTWTLPASDGTANQVLKTNGAGLLSWTTPTSGTVTSVTATAPLSVATGTTTPVVSIAAGSAAGQTLRWDGTSAWAATKLKYTDLVNGLSASPWPASCTAGQGLSYSTITDSFTCVTLVGGASNGITNGGNTLGANISIGTTDAFDLKFITNNSANMTVTSAGNVGVGTTAPTSKLSVQGAIVSNGVSNAAGVSNINFAAGNVQRSANATNNQAFNLCGLQDGGQYTLILSAQPNGSIPTFNAYSDAACSSGIPDFDQGGVTFLVSSPTVILTFVRSGSTVYAMFAAGFTK